jgi:hypothetical protein
VDSKNANQLFKKLKAKTDEQDCPNLYEARFLRRSGFSLSAECGTSGGSSAMLAWGVQ